MLRDAINIPNWLENDPCQDWQARIDRDRKIGLSLSTKSSDAFKRVIEWWALVSRSGVQSNLGADIQRLFSRLTLVIIGLAAISGVGISSAVLMFEGSAPINILVALGWLVVLPLILVVTSVMLPFITTKNLFSSSGLSSMLLSVLRSRTPGAVEFLSQAGVSSHYENVLRWRLMLSSQIFGMTFSVAALLVLVLKASLTDLAFGWGTTLDLDTNTLWSFTQITAFPWSMWFEGALPSETLIEQSQIFRLSQNMDSLPATLLTQWWPYLAMMIAVYGIAPRCVLLIIAHIGYRAAIKNCLLGHVEVRALLARLNSPQITSQSLEPELTSKKPFETAPLNPSSHEKAQQLIIWNQAPWHRELTESMPISHVGGEHMPDHDVAQIKNIDQTKVHSILVITKAWEPPLLDFHDFIQSLRAHCGPDTLIAVRPVAESGGTASSEQRAVWASSLAQLTDAKVVVE